MTIARPVAALRGQRNFRVAFAAQSGAVGTSGKPQATQPLIQRMFLQARLDLTEPADQEVYPTWIVLIRRSAPCKAAKPSGMAWLPRVRVIFVTLGQTILWVSRQHHDGAVEAPLAWPGRVGGRDRSVGGGDRAAQVGPVG